MRRIAIAILLLIAVGISAQHYLTTDIHAGYSRLLPMPSSGVTGGLGVGYGYRYRHLLLHAGLEADYGYMSATGESYIEHTRTQDSEQQSFLLHADYAPQRQQSGQLTVGLPIQLGAQVKRFYFLLGVRPGMRAWGQAHTSGLVTLSATYDEFWEDFADMPNHGLTTRSYDSPRYALSHAMMLSALGEVGVILGSQYERVSRRHVLPQMRLAAYVDYRVWSAAEPQPAGLTVGLRASVYLAFPKQEKCRCMDKQRR